jgi:hypothetical protein
MARNIGDKGEGMTDQLEKCGNCERAIGKLETPYLWRTITVCHECYERLRRQEAIQTTPAPAHEEEEEEEEVVGLAGLASKMSTAPASRPRPKAIPPGAMICQNPHCGALVRPTRKSRGSVVVMILLFFVGVLPGILYALLMSGYDYFCPRCGMKLRTEHR